MYGSGEPGPDFSLPSTIQNLKDTVQRGENKKDLDALQQRGEDRKDLDKKDLDASQQRGEDRKDLDDSQQRVEDKKNLDDSQHLIIKIPSFPAIVQLGVGKKVLVDPMKFFFYLHSEERCLPYCLWVLSFCCHSNKYKEGFLATQLRTMKVSKIFFLAIVIPTAQMSGGITNLYRVDTWRSTHCTHVQCIHSVITHIDGNPFFPTIQAHNKPKVLFAPFLKAKDQGVAKDFSFEITFAAEEKQLKQLNRAARPMALSVHSLASSYTKPLHGLGGGTRRVFTVFTVFNVQNFKVFNVRNVRNRFTVFNVQNFSFSMFEMFKIATSLILRICFS